MNSTRSWKTPTPEQVTQAVALLGQAAQARYFFDRLSNPEWIQPLRERGLFRRPPPAERNEEKGTISFPPWPASRYLARMASERPDLVRDVILQMERTDNLAVHEDILGVALRTPSPIAAELATRLMDEVSRLYSPLPEKFAALMLHLARGGEHRRALQLARYLLEPIRVERPPLSVEGEDIHLSPDAEAKVTEYEYREIVEESYLAVVTIVGTPALLLLCDLLEHAVRISHGERQEPPYDYSSIWRPAIEDHGQNISSDIENILVSGLRNAAEQLIQSDRRHLTELVDLLERRPWHVFHRIALHLLRVFSDLDEARNAIAVRLTNKDMFEASWARHEYVLLESKVFASLAERHRAVILGWIEEGPDLEAFRRSNEEWTGTVSTEADVEKYRKAWQRDRLAPIREGLPSDSRQLYDRLIADVGQPEHPEFSSYSMSFTGPTSPISIEQLSGMPVDEIVEFLQRWRSPSEHFAPTPEGLARNLSDVVKADPGRFAAAAHGFQSLDPTYVRALFRGLADAAGESRSFDWRGVLSLATWVLDQPVVDEGRRSGRLDRDPGWGWSRKAIAGLLTVAFRGNSIPIDERERAWSVLRPLTDDADPTAEEDASSGMDPLTMSINTTRGEAMHAVVQYALWLHRHFKALGEEERVRAGFASMPEVREVLERRLQPEIEPTRAVRAVYGQWFPWLTLLDSQWARDRAANIFPSPDVAEAFWRAAWGTYIVFCPPYSSVLEILRDQYQSAVERLGVDQTERDSLSDPDRRLAEHLVMFYGRGHLSFEDPLFVRFWGKASPKVAAHAISYIGRSLREEREQPEAVVVERFKVLWEARLAAISVVGRERGAEAAAFGWWFVSGRFDDLWATTNLLNAIRIARTVEFDTRVVERLAVVAAALPRQALEALALLLEDAEPWKIYAWRESIRRITSVTLQSGDAVAKKEAEKLVNGLGQRGYFDLRDLLRQAQ